MKKQDLKMLKELQKGINKWIKKNNWKGGKCKKCGKQLLPIIDFKTICDICEQKEMNDITKELVKRRDNEIKVELWAPNNKFVNLCRKVNDENFNEKQFWHIKGKITFKKPK